MIPSLARVMLRELFRGQSERAELVSFRARLLGILLPVLAVLGALPIALVVPSLYARGDHAYAALYLGSYLLLATLAIAGDRIPGDARVLGAIGVGFAAAVVGLFRLRLSGNALLIMLLFVAVAAVLLGARAAVATILGGVVAIVAAAVYFEVLAPSPAPLVGPSGVTAWATAAIVFCLVASLVALGPLLVIQRLSDALRLEGERRHDLEESIRRRADAERQRDRSEQRFRELGELLPEAIWEATPNGKLTYVNGAGLAVFGYADVTLPEDVRVFAHLAEHEHERARANWMRSLQGQRPGLVEYEARRANGEPFPCLIRSTPIVRDGEVIGLRGILIDNTERRRLEERLRTNQKMEALGLLAGGVAHDFNNLLTAIQGHVSLLLLDEAARERRESLEAIGAAMDSASRLVRQLLGLGRRGERPRSPRDVGELVAGTVEIFRRGRREISIELSGTGSGLVAAVDPDAIQQVILNLLVNAWHAMPDGGNVAVSIERAELGEGEVAGTPARPGPFACVSVRDSGVGIRPEHLSRVFEPFFTTKPDGQGSGLGLATSYASVTVHQGLMRVESAPGRGATFRVYLPLEEEAAVAAAG